MRAVGVVQFGGPERLQVVDIPEPHPGLGEVRVRVYAAAVNPTDTGLRAGAYGTFLTDRGPPPYIPGMEAAGLISEVGRGVSWSVGDEVMLIARPTEKHGGTYADHVVVPAESVVAKPAGADFAAASTLPMNGLTAWLTLNRLALAPGQTLAVTGAAGTYGGYVIQLAKAAGLRVIADAAEKDEALVRSFGPDDVVRRGDDVPERIRAVLPQGVDAVADGAVQNELVLPAIRDGGQLAVVRGWAAESERDIKVRKIFVGAAATNTAALDELRRNAEAGVLTLRVAQVLPAEQAVQAHKIFEAGGVRGRLVLDFRD